MHRKDCYFKVITQNASGEKPKQTRNYLITHRRNAPLQGGKGGCQHKVALRHKLSCI